MLDKETLTEVNDRSRRPGASAAVLAVLAGFTALAALAALAVGFADPVLAGAVLVAGVAAAAATFAVYLRSSPGVTPLRYDLDGAAAERFAAAQRACEGLAAAEKVWARDPASAGAEGRRPAEAGILETPGISTDVDVWGVSTGETRIHFFPDAVLYHAAGRYRAVPYPAFEVALGEEDRLEEGEVPEDAEVINQTWRHVRDDGSPDLRFTSNPKLTTVRYGTLRFSAPSSGLALELVVSSRSAAERFARRFRVAPEESEEKERQQAPAPPGVPQAPASAAHAVLGLEAGATKSEVTAAYRRLAREHHPDAVAGLSPESQKTSEARMKEINAAYAELRHRV